MLLKPDPLNTDRLALHPSVQAPSSSSACCSPSVIASSYPSGGYLYFLKIRILTRTLSLNCQSTVVLFRSFSMSSLAARRGCILLPNNPSTHSQLFPDSYRAAECSPSLFRLCERILSLSNRSTSSTARFFRPKRRKFRVQPPHRLRQSPFQNHSPEILPLRCLALRRNHLPVHVAPPRILEPLDRELLELVFGDHFLMR